MDSRSQFEKNTHNLSLTRVLPAKRWKVLRLISRVNNYPWFMPNVKACEVISKSRSRAVTAWHVEIGGIPIRWKQEDQFEFKDFRIQFKLIEGDLQKLEGEWILRQSATGDTEATVQVAVKVGLPQIEDVVGSLIAEKLKENFKAILDAYEDMIAMQRYRTIAERKNSDVSGFAVMCHPYDYGHLIEYIRFFDKDIKLPSKEFLHKVFELAPSYASLELKNFRSRTGKVTHGHFIMCPIVPDMLSLDLKGVVRKVVEACKIAEKLKLGIVALGGFTSIAGEMNNKSIRQLVHIPVTTGNTYTVAMAVQGVRKACQVMGIDLSGAKVTILGGAGDIGGGCAKILAKEVREITITSRTERNLVDAERTLSYLGRAKITTSRDNHQAVKDADVVISAASSTKPLVVVEDFKSGAVVCDIGYPKNISYAETDRQDIFVFSGGICSLPSEFDFGFDVGLPSTKTLYGCYAEAIILDLEEQYVNFSEGRGNITEEKVNEITAMGEKHGFGLAPFFWGHRMLTEDDLQVIHARHQ